MGKYQFRGPSNALSTLTYDSDNNQVTFAVSTEPEDGDSVIVQFEEQEYTLTMVNGEIEVTGGEENRLTAILIPICRSLLQKKLARWT